MKKGIYSGLTIIMAALILLTAGHFSRAEEAKVSQPDAAVGQLTEQFDFSKQQTQGVISSQTNADQLGKEIIIKRLDKNFWIICSLLLAMLVSHFTLMYFIRKGKHCADDIVHASGLVLIIFGTILIILVADTEQQMTASIGIMGAVAGYLFGTMTRTRDIRQGENNEELKVENDERNNK